MSLSLDVEGLISRLSGPLDPADRSAFRHAAESALAASECWGEGLAYRVVTDLWRSYFHPPPNMYVGQPLHGQKHRNKLINAPPLGRSNRSDEL
jgi:hypothetical protein